jgi:hypothetical protein
MSLFSLAYAFALLCFAFAPFCSLHYSQLAGEVLLGLAEYNGLHYTLEWVKCNKEVM